MAATVYLSVGDGATTDHLDITEWVLSDGLNAPPPVRNATTRTVGLSLEIADGTPEAVFASMSDIEQKLQQAESLARPQSGGSGVTLGLQMTAASNMVYFDVLRGSLIPDASGLEFYSEGVVRGLTLELTCLPYARGDAVTETFTNQTNYSELWITGVGGDVEALARVTITDKSTNSEVINRVRLSRRSGWNLGETDFEPVVALAATGAGTDSSDAGNDDYHGTTYARVTATADWQTFAYADRPTADTFGEVDLLARLRDSSGVLAAPRITGVTVADGGITLRQANDGQGVIGVLDSTLRWDKPTLPGTLLVLTMIMRTENGPDGWVTGNTVEAGWVEAVSDENTSTGVNAYVWHYYYPDNPGGREFEDVTFTGPTGTEVRDFIYVLTEWDGMPATSLLDQTASNPETSNTRLHSTGETLATDQVNELVITGHTIRANATTQFLDYTDGYTLIGQGGTGVVAYTITTETGTQEGVARMQRSNQSVNIIATFRGGSTVAGALPPGNYLYRIVPYDASGNFGAASLPFAGRLLERGSASLAWSTVIGASGYYLYWKEEGGDWLYIDVGNVTSYDHVATYDGVAEDPTVDLTNTLVRARICSGTTGEVLRTFPDVRCDIGADGWEDVVLARGVNLAPHLAIDGGDPDNWRIELQAKHDDLSGETLDADVLILVPHDEAQLELRYVDGNGVEMENDTQRAWRYDLRRDLRSSAVLLDKTTDALIARVRHQGRFMLHPGNDQVLVATANEDGVSEMDDTLMDIEVRYVPRYRFLSSD